MRQLQYLKDLIQLPFDPTKSTTVYASLSSMPFVYNSDIMQHLQTEENDEISALRSDIINILLPALKLYNRACAMATSNTVDPELLALIMQLLQKDPLYYVPLRMTPVNSQEEEMKSKLILNSGINALDNLFSDGVETLQWLEISGKPGCYKTQLSLHFILSFLEANECNRAIYFDCGNGGLFVRRILELNINQDGERRVSQIEDHIELVRCCDVNEVQHDLELFKNRVVSDRATRWIAVVDSVGFLMSSLHDDKRLWFDALNSLSYMLNSLSKYCLVVVINHVVTEQTFVELLDPESSQGRLIERQTKPSLGKKWAQNVNTQVILSRSSEMVHVEMRQYVKGKLIRKECAFPV